MNNADFDKTDPGDDITSQQEAEISEQVVTLLRKFRLAGPSTISAQPDDKRVLHYLNGELTGEEAREFEEWLIDSREVRQRMREARAAQLEFKSLTWSQVQARASTGDALAAAWSEIERDRANGLVELWQTACDRLRKGTGAIALATANEASEMRRALTAFLQQWTRERRWEAAFPAVARGFASPTATNQGSRLSIRVDAAGGLHAILEGGLRVASGESVMDIDAQLFAANVVGELPLGARRLTGGRAEWDLPGIGDLLDLVEGSVSPALFRVADVTGESEEPGPAESIVIADVLDAASYPIPNEMAALRVKRDFQVPEADSEIVALEVWIDGATRFAFADHWLKLDYVLADDSSVGLGSWPLAEWPENPRSLSVTVPAASGARRASYLPLRFQLAPFDPLKRG